MAQPNYHALESALEHGFFSSPIPETAWPALNESVQTVLMILKLFAHSESEIATPEIAKCVDIHVNTARLFLAWMEEASLLQRLNPPSRGSPSVFKSTKPNTRIDMIA